MLGHHFTGVVVPGNRRGRLLGFPTANVSSIAAQALPPDGVYVGCIRLPGRLGLFGATISMGWNQTFDDVMEHRVEAHIHDFAEEIYGACIAVTIICRLRDMQHFDRVEKLTWQIARDVERSRRLLTALMLPDGPAIRIVPDDIDLSTFQFTGDTPSWPHHKT